MSEGPVVLNTQAPSTFRLCCSQGGLPRWLRGKESSCHAGDGDMGSISGLGRSPEGGNGNSLQYSCLETCMDREAWGTTVHGAAKGRT